MVVQTDISSFYEHVYHHRLENVIKDLGAANSTVALQIDRILSKLAAGRSFGLPVGGQCARVLAEVMMTPIDRSLSDKGIVWHRYVDDFTLICNSRQHAYESLSGLSHALADYGLSLNRTKTTTLSAKHYVDYVAAQLGDGEDASADLRDLDLHFDHYSDTDTQQEDYETLKETVKKIDVQFLVDLEKEKSQPDNFVVTQISRALKFQEPKVAAQLCETLLNARNLDSFRASWSKIMRGVYAVRANDEFSDVHAKIDQLLDRVIVAAPHLLMPEANLLHFLRGIRFARTDARGTFVRRTYDSSSSATVRRACIDCWRHWPDRNGFNFVRNKWEILTSDEQRMLWLAAGNFGDRGEHARRQLGGSVTRSWHLGFEPDQGATFAACFLKWVKNGA